MRAQGPLPTFLLFLLSCLFTINVVAQDELIWGYGYNNRFFQSGLDMVVDKNGNTIVCGVFLDSLQPIPGQSANTLFHHYVDPYVIKYDPSGQVVFAFSYKSTQAAVYNTATALAVDDSGNVYVAGQFRNSIDLDPDTGMAWLYSGNVEGWLAKYDPNGNYLFGKQITSTSGDEFLSALHIDGSSIYVGGQTNSNQIYFAKFRLSDFAQNWVMDMGSHQYNSCNNIITDNNGNLIIAGTYNNTVDFNHFGGTNNYSSYGSSLYYDSYVAKYGPAGNFLWAYTFGGQYNDGVFDTDVDLWGNIYVVGAFQDTVDFKFGAGVAGSRAHYTGLPEHHNGFFLKIDANGNYAWHGNYGALSTDIVASVEFTSDHQLMICGSYVSQTGIDFEIGPGITIVPPLDSNSLTQYVVNFDTSGSVNWAKIIDYGPGHHGFPEHLIEYDSFYHIYGRYNGTFTPDTIPLVQYANVAGHITQHYAYVAKYRYCPPRGIFTTTHDTICANEFYVFDGQMLDTTGIYYDTLKTIHGCDSFAQLHLVVQNDSSSYSFSATACANDGYQFNGLTLNSSGLYIDTLVNMAGCDSFVILDFTYLPISSFSISDSICPTASYIFNGKTINAAGQYIDTLTNYHGCDSFVVLDLDHKPEASDTISVPICDDATYTFNGQNLSISGLYLDTLTGQNGCDSLITLDLKVNPTYSITTNAAICEGQAAFIQGSVYDTTGIYPHVLSSYYGCDSVLILDLVVADTQRAVITDTICAGHIFSFMGNQYTLSGSHEIILVNQFGCDSAIELHLTVLDTNTTNIVIDSSQTITANGFDSIQLYTCNGTVLNLLFNINPDTFQFPDSLLPGSFAAIGYLNGCADTTPCFEILSTGISQQNMAQSLWNVYPNPTDDILFVETKNINTATYIKIYDVNGRLILTDILSVGKSSKTISLHEKANGYYLVELSAEDNKARYQVIKQ